MPDGSLPRPARRSRVSVRVVPALHPDGSLATVDLDAFAETYARVVCRIAGLTTDDALSHAA